MKPKPNATEGKKGAHSSMLMRPHLEQCIQCGMPLNKNEHLGNWK